MFFFSAATYNGHRIHYDKDWARERRGLRRRPRAGPVAVGAAGPRAHRLDRRPTDGWCASRCRTAPSRYPGRGTDLRRSRSPGSARRRVGLVDLEIFGKRGDDVLMPGTATVALPQRELRMTGLRGEAAIVGIAELPAETQAEPAADRSPSTSTRGWRRWSSRTPAWIPLWSNGLVDARHRRVRHVRAGHAVGVPRACRSTSASASTSAARRRRAWCGAPPRLSSSACARRCWPSCPARPTSRGREARPRTDAQLVRRVEQQLRLPAGRVRDPVRQRRAERAPTRRSPSAMPREFGYDAAALARRSRSHQRDERLRPPRRGVPRQADHHRRRADQPDDRRPDPHARDRDAGAGRRRGADRERRRRAPSAASPGVGQGIRRAHPLQDADLRRRPHPHADRPRRRTGVRDGRVCSGPTSTWRRSTTATRSPC